MDTVKRKIAELQAKNGWTFQQAWQVLQSEQPHLFESDPLVPDTAGSPVTKWLSPPDVDPYFSQPIAKMSARELASAMIEISQRSDLMAKHGSRLIQAADAKIAEVQRNPFGTPLPPAPESRSKLDMRVGELKDAGLETKVALEHLRRTEPELFGDDEPAVEVI
jgi:hypothetical protein